MDQNLMLTGQVFSEDQTNQNVFDIQLIPIENANEIIRLETDPSGNFLIELPEDIRETIYELRVFFRDEVVYENLLEFGILFESDFSHHLEIPVHITVLEKTEEHNNLSGVVTALMGKFDADEYRVMLNDILANTLGPIYTLSNQIRTFQNGDSRSTSGLLNALHDFEQDEYFTDDNLELALETFPEFLVEMYGEEPAAESYLHLMYPKELVDLERLLEVGAYIIGNATDEHLAIRVFQKYVERINELRPIIAASQQMQSGEVPDIELFKREVRSVHGKQLPREYGQPRIFTPHEVETEIPRQRKPFPRDPHEEKDPYRLKEILDSLQPKTAEEVFKEGWAKIQKVMRYAATYEVFRWVKSGGMQTLMPKRYKINTIVDQNTGYKGPFCNNEMVKIQGTGFENKRGKIKLINRSYAGTLIMVPDHLISSWTDTEISLSLPNKLAASSLVELVIESHTASVPGLAPRMIYKTGDAYTLNVLQPKASITFQRTLQGTPSQSDKPNHLLTITADGKLVRQDRAAITWSARDLNNLKLHHTTPAGVRTELSINGLGIPELNFPSGPGLLLPEVGEHIFELSGDCRCGMFDDSVKIEVIKGEKAIIQDFKINGNASTMIDEKSSVELTWAIQGASELILDQKTTTGKARRAVVSNPAIGKINLGNTGLLKENSTIIMTAKGIPGTLHPIVSSAALVHLLVEPEIAYFKANGSTTPPSIKSQTTLLLTWDVRHAATVSIKQGNKIIASGLPAANGKLSRKMDLIDTTYTLIAENNGKLAQRSLALKVAPNLKEYNLCKHQSFYTAPGGWNPIPQGASCSKTHIDLSYERDSGFRKSAKILHLQKATLKIKCPGAKMVRVSMPGASSLPYSSPKGTINVPVPRGTWHDFEKKYTITISIEGYHGERITKKITYQFLEAILRYRLTYRFMAGHSKLEGTTDFHARGDEGADKWARNWIKVNGYLKGDYEVNVMK